MGFRESVPSCAIIFPILKVKLVLVSINTHKLDVTRQNYGENTTFREEG